MKWDNDDYWKEKWQIFDILRTGLAECHAKATTVKKLMDSIDVLFDTLTSTEMEETDDND